MCDDVKCTVCGQSNWIRPEENGDIKFPSTPAVRKCGTENCNGLHQIDAMIKADGKLYDMDKKQHIDFSDLVE